MLFRNWYWLAANMTEPEKALEVEIAALGERYRAQWLFPHMHHIADFVLLDRRIIVEVDGASHQGSEQQRKDILRTIELEKRGWAVVRVSNSDATTNPKGVCEMLTYLCSIRPSHAELLEALAALPPAVPKPPRKPRKTPTKLPKRALTPRGGSGSAPGS